MTLVFSVFYRYKQVSIIYFIKAELKLPREQKMTDRRKEGRKERIHNMGETAQCNKYKYVCVKYVMDMICTNYEYI